MDIKAVSEPEKNADSMMSPARMPNNTLSGTLSNQGNPMVADYDWQFNGKSIVFERYRLM
jgi:hypothetical protein